MEHSFKNQNQKIQSKTFKSGASFLNLKLNLKIIRLAKGHWSCQVTKTVVFIAALMKKTYLAVRFTKGYFFANLLTKKLWV